MKSAISALSLAIALAAAGSAMPAAAQQQQQQQQAGAEAQAPAIAPSKGALEALVALQEAVNANDAANIPALAAAADAVATTPEDRYLIATMRYKAAVAAKDNAAKSAALEAMVASGKLPQEQAATAQMELANMAYQAKQYDRAATFLEKAIALDPNNGNAVMMLAESRHEQGRTSDAVGVLTKAIAQATSAGRKPDENLYKRAAALAYTAKLPQATELSRAWVKAYPSEESWRDALRMYRNLQKPPQPVLLDLLRLARTVGALEGQGDYHPYAYAALEELASGEVQSVLEEGVAGGSISASDAYVKELIAEAKTATAGQRDRMAGLAKDALAAPSAKMAINAANIHYSYGDFAKATELYRAALTKSGVDKDMANLRLGMSLARAGDSAGATAALNAVGGARAEVAKYWLTYVQTRA